MNILVIDVGGTHVKFLVTGQAEPRAFASGTKLSAQQMVGGVKELAGGWRFDAVSIGYPGPVLHNRPVSDPHNLGAGWVGYDYAQAFGAPVRMMNDAAMQALGSYRGGKLLFLGFGTGLGTAMIVDSVVEPMELGHLPYRKATYEDYVGERALETFGKKRWRKCVADVIERLVAALEPEDVVLGGGNARRLKELPPGCRIGDNANAFSGGFRLWTETHQAEPAAATKPAARQREPAAQAKKTGGKSAAPAKKTGGKSATPSKKTGSVRKARGGKK